MTDADGLTPWLNMGVSGAFLALLWVVSTKLLPAAFERVAQELATKRAEFLKALEEERDARKADRVEFLKALAEQRASNDHKMTVINAAMLRLEAKMEAAITHLTTQMSHLTTAVTVLLEERRKREEKT